MPRYSGPKSRESLRSCWLRRSSGKGTRKCRVRLGELQLSPTPPAATLLLRQTARACPRSLCPRLGLPCDRASCKSTWVVRLDLQGEERLFRARDEEGVSAGFEGPCVLVCLDSAAGLCAANGGSCRYSRGSHTRSQPCMGDGGCAKSGAGGGLCLKRHWFMAGQEDGWREIGGRGRG